MDTSLSLKQAEFANQSLFLHGYWKPRRVSLKPCCKVIEKMLPHERTLWQCRNDLRKMTVNVDNIEDIKDIYDDNNNVCK